MVGAPGWLSQWSVCLGLRLWSWSPRIEPRIGLPAQRGVCLSLCSSPCSCSLSLSLSFSNKIFKKLFEKWVMVAIKLLWYLVHPPPFYFEKWTYKVVKPSTLRQTHRMLLFGHWGTRARAHELSCSAYRHVSVYLRAYAYTCRYTYMRVCFFFLFGRTISK